MEYDRPFLKIEDLLFRLEIIEKDKLGEREFFQQVLIVIKDMHKAGLTEEEFKEFSDKLQEIGCVDYKTWEEEKGNGRAKLKKLGLKKGSKHGSLDVGAEMIDICLHDYNLAKIQLNHITEKGEEGSFLEMWLIANKKILDGYKKSPDDTIENQEYRKKKEEEIKQYKGEKARIFKEIQEATKQIYASINEEKNTISNSKSEGNLEHNSESK